MCDECAPVRKLRRDIQPEPAIFLVCGTLSKFKMAAASSSGNDEVDDLFSRFMSEVTSNILSLS